MSVKEMVEYTAYIIEKQVPKDIFIKLFKDKNIHINIDYIDTVLKLQKLYISITKIYNNTSVLTQFITALKNSVRQKKSESFSHFPQGDVFTHFYSLFYQIIYPSGKVRHRVIKAALGSFDSNIVIKYDYHFNGTLIAEYKFPHTTGWSDYQYIGNIIIVKDFVLSQFGLKIHIWNTKSGESKIFDFEYDPYLKFALLYEDDKFIFGGSNYHVISHDDDLGYYTSNISLLDFKTGKHKHLHFPRNVDKTKFTRISLSYPLVNIDKSDGKTLILNPQTWTVQEVVSPGMETPEGESITFKDSSIIIDDDPIQVTDHIIDQIFFLNEPFILFKASIRVGIFNYRTRSVVKTMDSYSKMFILKSNNILFSDYHSGTQLFDSNLNLLYESPIYLGYNSIYEFPNSQLITVNYDTLKVLDWNKGIVFEKKNVNSSFALFPDGRVVIFIKDEALQIYE